MSEVKIQLPSIPTFTGKNIAAFGNKFAFAVVAQVALEDEAARLSGMASEAKSKLGFEMVRCIHAIALEKEDLNPWAVFAGKVEVEKYNNRLLTAMGILKWNIEDGVAVPAWTDEGIRKLYDYNETNLREKSPEQYEKRLANRQKLNVQIKAATKVVTELLNAGNKSPEDLTYTKDATGTEVPTIKHAPKEIRGNKSGPVQLGSKHIAEGATVSPSLSGLTKLSEARNSTKKQPAAGASGQRASDGAVLGMSDEQFGAVCNTLVKSINAQEGRFTAQMNAHLKAVLPVVQDALARGVSVEAKPAEPAKASNGDTAKAPAKSKKAA